MEGEYMTKTQRSKHASEIRKSHFKLGNHKESPKSPRRTLLSIPESSSNVAKAMRSTHFNLGQHKTVVESEHKHRYKDSKVPITNPYQKPDSSIDLRKHHYVLGLHQEPYSTTNTNTKQGEGEVALTIMTSAFSTSHHFKYGTDNPKKISTAREHYTEKTMSNNDKETVDKIKENLLGSHFEIGNEPGCYQTNNREDYKSFKVKPEIKKVELLKEHFELGTDKPSYNTMSQQNFNKKPQAKQLLSSETMKDLRQSHFLLGSKAIDYTLTSQEITGSRAEHIQPKIDDRVLRKTNFTMGNNANPWKTIYSTSHSESAKDITISTRDRNSDKKSSIILGNYNLPGVSNARADYIHHDYNNLIDKTQGEYLRKSHYQVGSYKSSFNTMYQKYGEGKAAPVEINEKFMKDLRSEHFKLGNDERDMATTNRTDFKPNSFQSAAKIEKMHGKHSYKDANAKIEWNTEQRSRFGWVNPVPDSTFKFSLE
jgi:hypothetical protein